MRPRRSRGHGLIYQCAALSITSLVLFSRVALGLDFLPPQIVELSGPGAGPRLAVGDLNQDCISDLVTLRNEADASDSPSMRLAPGDGLGGFPDPTSMAGERQVSDIELVDMNGDGSGDLVFQQCLIARGFPAGVVSGDYDGRPLDPTLFAVSDEQFIDQALTNVAGHLELDPQPM